MAIFAKQLQYVLKQHGKDFGQLYNIRVEADGYDGRPVSAEKIKHLRLAVQGSYKKSVTLNPAELAAIQEAFSFSPEEIRRLRAALAAESIRRFLLDRIDLDKAIVVGEALFQLLFDADDSAFIALRRRMISNIRDDEPDSGVAAVEQDSAQSISENLEQAIEIYEDALLWFDTAHITQSHPLRLGYLAMVTSLLTTASDLLNYIPCSAYDAAQQAEWRQIVAQTQQEVDDLIAD
jgi:hypothetical protein